MPKEFSRTRRVAAQLQRELAQIIQAQLKDPRVGIVTINAVEVSRDLAYAKIFVTVLGRDAKDATDALETLQQASAFLRRMLMQRMTIRTMPQLKFVFDESIERGAKLSALIDQAIASDQRKRR